MTTVDPCMDLCLNYLERRYFYSRTKGFATPNGYIGSNTWRAWQAGQGSDWTPSEYLKSRHVYTAKLNELKNFVRNNPNMTRESFDDFHVKQVNEFIYCCKQQKLHPRAQASSHSDGYAYNVYAKVIDLVYTHGCFRPEKEGAQCYYAAHQSHALRRCLHVPLDGKVLAFLGTLISVDIVKCDQTTRLPNGSMGSIKSDGCYKIIQKLIRDIVDSFDSSNFHGHKISPLALEVF